MQQYPQNYSLSAFAKHPNLGLQHGIPRRGCGWMLLRISSFISSHGSRLGCMRLCWSGPELPESHLSRCWQVEAACGNGGGDSSCFGLFPTTFGSSLSQPSSGCDPHEPATRLSLILSTSTAFTGSTRSTISSSTAALPAVAVWWRSICLFQVSILENLQQ